MLCDDVNYYAPLYLSGELDATTMADVEKHMQSCSSCRLFLEGEAELDSAVRAAVLADTPQASRVRSSVLAAVYASRAFEPRRRAWFSWQAMLATAAALCLVAAITAANWRNQSYFAAAIKDHIDDVVRVVAKSGWRIAEPEIRAYLAERFPNNEVVARLGMPGYQLVKVRDCYLRKQRYVHLIYEKDGRQISLFVLPRGRNALDRLATASMFVPVRSRMEQGLDVTEGDSAAHNVFVVGDLPTEEAQGFASRVLASLS
jgi:anti-sigma factor RsiW